MFRLSLIFIMLWFLSGCGQEKPIRKTLSGATLVYSTTSQRMSYVLQDQGFAEVAASADGIAAYRIVYDSVDAFGKPVKASGIITVPYSVLRGNKAKESVLFLHGTITTDSNSPSTLAKDVKATVGGFAYASVYGAVSLEPDYLGFGENRYESNVTSKHMTIDGVETVVTTVPPLRPKALHPYLQKRPLVEDTKRFLQAAHTFLKRHDLIASDDIDIVGYSEGGWLAVAMAEKLNEGGLPFVPKRLIAMDGPYDLNATAEHLFTNMFDVYPAYVALTMLSYATAADKNISELIVSNAAYMSFETDLAAGVDNFNVLNFRLQQSLLDRNESNDFALQPAFVSQWQSGKPFWFRDMLVQNSIKAKAYDFPIDLIHCRGDTLVPYRVAKYFAIALQDAGSAEVAIHIPDLTTPMGHEACYFPAISESVKVLRGQYSQIY